MASHQCPVDGCNKSFKNPWGLKVHFFRTHRELGTIESYLAARGNATSTALAVAPPSTTTKAPIIHKIIEILRASPGHRTTTSELIQKLAASGITSKTRDAINHRISSAIRSNPQSGILKPGRGQYQLDERSNVHVAVADAPPLDDLSDLPAEIRLRFKEIECRRLRNQLSANHELFAGMTRLLALSVMSQE